MGDKGRRIVISKRKVMMILSGILVIIVIFLLSHLTPSGAVRSYIFSKGYFMTAIEADVEFNEEQHNLDKEILEEDNSKIYTLISPDIEDRDGFPMINFKIKKVGFLYFAEKYGEA